MARKKVTVAYIENDATRRSTGRKRAMGAMKKASELSTLCGVQVCFIIVFEDGSLQAWPSPAEAMLTVDRYKSMPAVDQCKKKMDGEDYVRDRIAKMQEQLRKAERENRQREIMLTLHHAMSAGLRPDLAGLTIEQVIGIGWTTENLVKKIKDAIAYRGGQPAASVMKDDPSPYYASSTVAADVEALPHVQQGRWVREVVKAGWDLDDTLPYNAGNPNGNGNYGSVGAGSDVMQLGNMGDAAFAWGEEGLWFGGVDVVLRLPSEK